MNPLTPYLLWIKLGAALALVGALVGWHVHAVSSARSDGRSEAIAERAAADLSATISRNIENDAEAVRQRAANVTITKAKDEELAPIRARISTDRVRVGPAICDGPPMPAKATGTTGSDGASPEGRVLSESMDRDIRALILETEEAMATGRACEAFLNANGLVP